MKAKKELRIADFELRINQCDNPKLTIRNSKSHIYIWLLILSLPMMFSSPARGADTVMTKYDRGNRFYQQQDYENAIKSYEDVLKADRISPDIYFNLGNSYFKTGNVAQSILNYERAHKLAPNDEDIDFNLKLAELKVVDKIDPIPEVFYKRWINTLALALKMDVWSRICIALMWLTAFLFAAFVIASSAGRKKTFFVLGLIALLLTLTSYYFDTVQDDIVNHDQHAIVMAASSYVKSSPDEKGNDQFILHEGTKVEVLDEYSDWKKIKIANGTVGWIKAKDIEVI